MSPSRSLAILSVGGRNPRGGITYHLAHKLADIGENVLVVDCGFSPFVTEGLIGEQRLHELWQTESLPGPIPVGECLFLLPGDPQLALRDSAAADGLRERIDKAARQTQSSWILVVLDLPPTQWGQAAMRLARASLIVAGARPWSLRALPVAGSLFDGPQDRNPTLLGYLVPQSLQRIFGSEDLDATCLAAFPAAFRQAFGLSTADLPLRPQADPNCLGLLERPAGLYELATEAGKPAFHLRSADGASESLLHAAFEANRIYGELVDRITERYDALVPP